MGITIIVTSIICPIITGLVVEVVKGFPLSQKIISFTRRKKVSKQQEGHQEEIPEFTEYIKDYIDGFVYKWQWRHFAEGWRIDQLRACCPKDETPLVVENMFNIKCPRCKKEYYDIPDINTVITLIQDNVSRKYGAISV